MGQIKTTTKIIMTTVTPSFITNQLTTNQVNKIFDGAIGGDAPKSYAVKYSMVIKFLKREKMSAETCINVLDENAHSIYVGDVMDGVYDY